MTWVRRTSLSAMSVPGEQVGGSSWEHPERPSSCQKSENALQLRGHVSSLALSLMSGTKVCDTRVGCSSSFHPLRRGFGLGCMQREARTLGLRAFKVYEPWRELSLVVFRWPSAMECFVRETILKVHCQKQRKTGELWQKQGQSKLRPPATETQRRASGATWSNRAVIGHTGLFKC